MYQKIKGLKFLFRNRRFENGFISVEKSKNGKFYKFQAFSEETRKGIKLFMDEKEMLEFVDKLKNLTIK